MKISLVMLLFVLFVSCAAKRSVDAVSTDQKEPGINMPACVKELITKFKNEEKQNPARRVYSYDYNGTVVYYVPAICCDFFSDLYDSSCKLTAHPDGGITGRGDGTAVDFINVRTNEKLIWKDER
ncbi:MAG: hypothetical protein ABIO04_05105 [Ferruginibacter sp.]